MFTKSAQWYDALYDFKNYAKESAAIISLLREAHPKAHTILDVACGTAEHDRYLVQAYHVDGLDINPDFAHIASGKNPDGKYFCADMADFDLEKSYDIILCLFGSIGYAKTIGNVVAVLRCFKKHLYACPFYHTGSLSHSIQTDHYIKLNHPVYFLDTAQLTAYYWSKAAIGE